VPSKRPVYVRKNQSLQVISAGTLTFVKEQFDNVQRSASHITWFVPICEVGVEYGVKVYVVALPTPIINPKPRSNSNNFFIRNY